MRASFAISGKGGTGKTTLAALIINTLKNQGKTPVLAIDADANFNLNELLGVKIEATIGALREEILKEKIPTGMAKETFLEYRIQEILTEANGFDLLVMGRSEGSGCYCYVNNVLRKYMDILSQSYPFVVMDNEAGMEHLSRKTTQSVDYLLISSDSSLRGIEAASRIRDLAIDLDLKIKESFLVVSRVSPDGLHPALEEAIKEKKLELIGTIPEDPLVQEFELSRKSLLELPASSGALKSAEEMVNKIFKKQSRVESQESRVKRQAS